MSPIPEAKTGAPNIQDVFLNYARREKLPVTVHLLDGRKLVGPRELQPLPVLGVPGWWPDNEAEGFYDNRDYFRPGRQAAAGAADQPAG